MTAGRFIDQLARIVTDPASNLTGAAVLLAMVVLVLLILAVAALITVLPGIGDSEPEDDERKAAKRPKRRDGASLLGRIRRGWAERRNERILWVLPLLLVFAGLMWGWSVTSDPQRCASCHATAPSEASWQQSDHKQVGCVTCHEDNGVGLPAAVMYRVGDALAAMRGQDKIGTVSRPVPAYRCMACHREIADRTLTSSGIRVSHKEFLASGYTCERCHARVGHTRAEALERAVPMRECVSCHDGGRAASVCSTCHVGDPSSAVRVDRSLFTKIDIPIRRGCEGCHQTKTCTACHGLEMPHPSGFEAGKGHARLASFGGWDRVCYRCHIPQDCSRCHRGAFPQHGSDWNVKHPSGIPLDGKPRGCGCHRSKDFCGLCHQTSAKRR